VPGGGVAVAVGADAGGVDANAVDQQDQYKLQLIRKGLQAYPEIMI
jgi:hypothetical protein